MKNDPFKQIRETQEIFRRATFPLRHFQQSYQTMNASSGIAAISKIIQKQQEMLNVGIRTVVNESIGAHFNPIQDAFERMTRNPVLDIQIPQIVYPQLELMLEVFQNSIPESDSSDLKASITVRNPELVSTEKPSLTWGQLFTVLVMICQVLYPVYSDQQTSLQREQIHQDQMEQNERHHLEEMEQDERHHQELLEQNERHHQEEMKAFANFVTFIQPLIPSDSQPESEDH